MSETDIVERSECDWRALAPESWDQEYRELWICLARTNDRLARWRRDYRSACIANAAMSNEIADLRSENAELRGALEECADDLAAEIEARVPPAIRVYPSLGNKYDRDMAPVHRARALLTHSDKE